MREPGWQAVNLRADPKLPPAPARPRRRRPNPAAATNAATVKKCSSSSSSKGGDGDNDNDDDDDDDDGGGTTAAATATTKDSPAVRAADLPGRRRGGAGHAADQVAVPDRARHPSLNGTKRSREKRSTEKRVRDETLIKLLGGGARGRWEKHK